MSSPRYVLYIDDDQDDRDAFREVAKDVAPSFECIFAKDGQEALELLPTLNVTLTCVYADINMPRINGIEFLATIKADPMYSTVPVFILSTSDAPRQKAQAQMLGAAAYFVKPNSYLGFVELLKTCFLSHLLT